MTPLDKKAAKVINALLETIDYSVIIKTMTHLNWTVLYANGKVPTEIQLKTYISERLWSTYNECKNHPISNCYSTNSAGVVITCEITEEWEVDMGFRFEIQGISHYSLELKDEGTKDMINEHDIDAFKEYQSKAWKTALHSARNDKYMYTGLAAEVGEVMSLFAKAVRDGSSANYNSSLKKELGDVLWFISGIATLEGLSLSDIAKANIDKLNSRKERGTLQGAGDDR